MNKDLIRERFSKNLKNYNDNAKIQKKMAERLITYLKNNKYKKVLEIGCGTGFLTDLVVNSINYEIYTAVDIVEDCKEYIKEIDSNIDFIPADIEVFINNDNEKYDLIISNASLQWTENFKKTAELLYSKLNNDGELLFSTFGKENFREIYYVVGSSLNYFSNNELQEMFPNSTIESEIHVLAFKNAKDVLKHLQLTGVNALEQKSWTKKDLLKFENGYKNFCGRLLSLTYNPIYIHQIK